MNKNSIIKLQFKGQLLFILFLMLAIISCLGKEYKTKIITHSSFKTYLDLCRGINNYVCDSIEFKFNFKGAELLDLFDHCDNDKIIFRHNNTFSISDDEFSRFNIDSIDFALDKHLQEYIINPRKLEHQSASPDYANISIRLNKIFPSQQTIILLEKIAASYKKIKIKNKLTTKLKVRLMHRLVNPPPPPPSYKHVFFLHNRFLETHDFEEPHKQHGKVEYLEILKTFRNEGFNVYSEHRNGNINAMSYAQKIKSQIDSLLLKNIKPSNITVIGTSKGGYIAQYVSTLCANQNLNFIFIACYRNSDIENLPEIYWHGHILNIYERTDSFGVSAVERIKISKINITNFKEVELNTGLKHGFLFKDLREWTKPCIDWINQHY